MARRAAPNERLRRAREERNWTQAEVANGIGTSGFTVSRWEMGIQAPQPFFREKLCRLFEMSPQELGLIPELPPPPEAPLVLDPALAEAPPASDPPPDTAEARARRDLLAQVWRYWIGTELETATGGVPRIDLGLTARPGAVDDPVRVLVPLHEPDRPLAGGATIADAYRDAGEQILVLGEPGAGKTTLLLDLARHLMEAGPAGPMPVVFHLSSWADERRPLARWLVEELRRRYGVARRLGRAWIAGEQVLPLLDGLDEVSEQHRAACVSAINDFHGDHGQLPLAVCCRTAQYERQAVKLRLRGAIVIQPLARAQVERYLAGAGDAMAGVRALVDDDPRLWELVTTPLFLSIIVRTYGGDGAARPPLSGTLPERRRHVLADYVAEMLARPRAAAAPLAYPARQTVHWLAGLARSMRERGEGVFYVDWMQPALLPSAAQRRLVMLGPGALVVLVGGLVGTLDMLVASLLLGGHTYLLDVANGLGRGVRFNLPDEVIGGMLAGAVVGMAAGLLAAVFTYERRIAPTDRLRWSWATFQHNLPSVLAAVLGGMVVSLLIDRVLSGVVVHLAYGLLLVLLFKALTREASDVDAGDRARRSWTPSRRHLVAAGAVALAAAVAAAMISGAPPATLVYRLGTRLVVGLSLGLMFGPETPLFETLPGPGQGIGMSRRNGLTAGLLSGAAAALLFGSVDGLSVARNFGGPTGAITGLADGLSIAVIVAMGVGLRRGGGAYLRHVLLHRLLVRCGAAPRDCIAFLDHASNLILLRRRGAGYEFVHGLLLDHFADLAGGGAETRPSAARRETRRFPLPTVGNYYGDP